MVKATGQRHEDIHDAGQSLKLDENGVILGENYSIEMSYLIYPIDDEDTDSDNEDNSGVYFNDETIVETSSKENNNCLLESDEKLMTLTLLEDEGSVVSVVEPNNYEKEHKPLNTEHYSRSYHSRKLVSPALIEVADNVHVLSQRSLQESMKTEARSKNHHKSPKSTDSLMIGQSSVRKTHDMKNIFRSSNHDKILLHPLLGHGSTSSAAVFHPDSTFAALTTSNSSKHHSRSHQRSRSNPVSPQHYRVSSHAYPYHTPRSFDENRNKYHYFGQTHHYTYDPHSHYSPNHRRVNSAHRRSHSKQSYQYSNLSPKSIATLLPCGCRMKHKHNDITSNPHAVADMKCCTGKVLNSPAVITPPSSKTKASIFKKSSPSSINFFKNKSTRQSRQILRTTSAGAQTIDTVSDLDDHTDQNIDNWQPHADCKGKSLRRSRKSSASKKILMLDTIEDNSPIASPAGFRFGTSTMWKQNKNKSKNKLKGHHRSRSCEGVSWSKTVNNGGKALNGSQEIYSGEHGHGAKKVSNCTIM